MPDQVTFTPKELTKIQLIAQEICPDTFDDKELPTDLHIITYSVGGEKFFDAVRAYTKVDIFDAYYDKLRGIGTIHSISSGHGRIKPKLYGKINTES
tara:strand:+ start:62 stop:352 length:291 start_codon:yes stop_codon:yes gene_type:complete